jgi:hypothetical protein
VDDAHFTLIGMKRPPEKGAYAISLGQFASKTLKLKGDDLTALLELQGKASRGPWTAREHPQLEAWLQANQTPLGLVHRATRLSRCYFALVTREKDGQRGDLIGALLPSVQSCRSLAALLSTRAMLRLGEGKHEQAWNDLHACHRLGRLLQQGNTLIEVLVGLAIEQVAIDATVPYLAHSRPGEKKLAALLADLRKLPPPGDIADKVNWGERFMFLDTVRMLDLCGASYLEALSSGPGKVTRGLGMPGVDLTATLRYVNPWYDRMVDALRAPTRAQRVDRLTAIDREARDLKAKVNSVGYTALGLLGGSDFRGRQIGQILVGLLMPAIQKLHDAGDRLRQNHANLLLAMELERIHRKQGAYPEKLPDKAPTDLFTGKPLIYRLDDGGGYVLYSVGPNGKDDGGKSRVDMPPGDDLVIRMPKPAK